MRYFKIAGSDPLVRLGQSPHHTTHLIKVASETALGRRPFVLEFWTDYPTRDRTSKSHISSTPTLIQRFIYVEGKVRKFLIADNSLVYRL